MELRESNSLDRLETALRSVDAAERKSAVGILSGFQPRSGRVEELLNSALKDEIFEVWAAATAALSPPGELLHRLPGMGQRMVEVAASLQIRLPCAGWKFLKDPEEKAHLEECFKPDCDDSCWEAAETESHWEPGYVGAGWYRRWIDLPDAPEHSAVELLFEGVDESCCCWINGAYVGGQDIGHQGWNKPFRVSVTREIVWNSPNLIAARVKNTVGGGGIWKPVFLEALVF